MCKKLFSSLLGGGSTDRSALPAPAPDAPRESDAAVKNTDVVNALLPGTEASGRVRLGGARKNSTASVGLSL